MKRRLLSGRQRTHTDHEPGEIYFAELDTGRRPAIVVSREELNRGDYVVAVLCTSADFQTRSRYANCVPFRAGEFSLTKDCVTQCESILFVRKARLDSHPIGVLDEAAFRNIVRAIGYLLDADCEPT